MVCIFSFSNKYITWGSWTFCDLFDNSSGYDSWKHYTIVPAYQFWGKTTEWDQHDIEYYRVKGTPYMSYQCPLLPDLFNVMVILRQVHKMTTEWSWKSKIKCTGVNYYCSWVPNITPRCSTANRPLWLS